MRNLVCKQCYYCGSTITNNNNTVYSCYNHKGMIVNFYFKKNRLGGISQFDVVEIHLLFKKDSHIRALQKIGDIGLSIIVESCEDTGCIIKEYNMPNYFLVTNSPEEVYEKYKMYSIFK